MEWSYSVYLQQYGDCLHVSTETGKHQRCVAIVILLIQFGIALQQQPHHLHTLRTQHINMYARKVTSSQQGNRPEADLHWGDLYMFYVILWQAVLIVSVFNKKTGQQTPNRHGLIWLNKSNIKCSANSIKRPSSSRLSTFQLGLTSRYRRSRRNCICFRLCTAVEWSTSGAQLSSQGSRTVCVGHGKYKLLCVSIQSWY